MEGDPFALDDESDTGLEYLFGVSWIDAKGKPDYRAFWAHTREEEGRAFEAFVDFVDTKLDQPIGRLKAATVRIQQPWVEGEAYEVPSVGRVPFVDVAGTFDATSGETCLLALNRDLQQPRELQVAWRDGAPAGAVRGEVLTGSDLKATNTLASPATVVPRPLESPRLATEMTFELPARSYSVIRLAKA